ncbi:type 2 isopentenyl-diphosphate Delta-isomerase [Candidatus Bathyarchaeota archaeon]|nr:type 2 isopentenyl-diphosphate Delta-isomerase [Candidatus Bathyarchaeota archaeon]
MTRSRKEDHLRICLEKNVEARGITTGFEEVFLIHQALPELNLSDVKTETIFLNHRFSAPIIVEGMTGGTSKALEINSAIAQAVEELGLGMGVGSQRAALENPEMEKTFAAVREKAPKAFIISNIGGPQIAGECDINKISRVVEMINADALTIHLNPLQEAIQPEGEKVYSGVIDNIRRLVERLDVPVIVKETGSGISAETARSLKEAGVACIDVAGAGGTSWAAVEYYRAVERGDSFGRDLGLLLWDWGIPTAISLVEVAQSVDLPVIASGGLRSGLDVAKAIALGASMAGLARPILMSASRGYEDVTKTLRSLIEHLKNIMFLAGAASIGELREAPLVILGRTAEWLKARGFNPEIYARRKPKR